MKRKLKVVCLVFMSHFLLNLLSVLTSGLPEICDSQRNRELDPSIPKSYLLCPPSLTIEHLKKFLCLKIGSVSAQKIEIMYDDKPLNKDMTLIDIAYIYAWRRVSCN